MATEKIRIGIDDQVIELTGQAKADFIADREASLEAQRLLETKYKEKQEAKQNILKKLGLTQDELETLLGA
jgi:hypothetical protein